MSSVLNMLRDLWDFLGSNPGDRHFSSGERPGLKVLRYLNSHGVWTYRIYQNLFIYKYSTLFKGCWRKGATVEGEFKCDI